MRSIPDFYKKVFQAFKKFPITLYAIEFSEPQYVNENVYLTRQDRTINFFTPHYSNGFVTRAAVDSSEVLVPNAQHFKLEESDLHVAGIKAVQGNSPLFVGTGASTPVNRVLDETTSDPSFTDEADVFLNLRNKQAAQILKIGLDRVTVAVGPNLETGEQIDIRALDPFVILRKRSFIPAGISHEDFTLSEASEKINFNLKLDNLTSLWSQKWMDTNKFESAKITIIFTYGSFIKESGDSTEDSEFSKKLSGFDYETFVVNSSQFNNLVMTLKCIDRLQSNTTKILRRMYTKNQCSHIFGRHACGVDFDTFQNFDGICNGSWDNCKQRNNTRNFGGYPNIPGNDSGGEF